ncbi:MAG: AzlD domain-containing protein [Oscillospiraceae bacterium]|nr:AzlD domain-containing protein [Oscillospiraceae bacterium]MDD7294198.1 AzlD domain-containing protein [Oscillospiraceae bacterium]MDY2510521.1 AzlD domain-containing protein [Ruminococcus callidus]
MKVACSILVMAVVTYLIRMLPMTIFRKKIQSQFLQDFLYYIPYAVLSAMTIPAVFYATADVPSAVLATIAAILLAWKGLPLIVVALAASGTAFLTALIEKLFF